MSFRYCIGERAAGVVGDAGAESASTDEISAVFSTSETLLFSSFDVIMKMIARIVAFEIDRAVVAQRQTEFEEG